MYNTCSSCLQTAATTISDAVWAVYRTVDPGVCWWPSTDLADSHANISMLVDSTALLTSGACQVLGGSQTWPLGTQFSPLTCSLLVSISSPASINTYRIHSHSHRRGLDTQEIWCFWEKAELLGGTMWTVLLCAVAKGDKRCRQTCENQSKTTNWIVTVNMKLFLRKTTKNYKGKTKVKPIKCFFNLSYYLNNQLKTSSKSGI